MSIAEINTRKLQDILSLRDYGAVGNGITDDTTAVTTANGVVGTKFIPAGTFKTTIAGSSLTGPYKGLGQIKDAAKNKHAPNMAAAVTAPTSKGNLDSILTAFNGDLSKCQNPVEHLITGAGTLGTPATGYVYTPEVAAQFTYMYNNSGWNQSTSSNVGRTCAAANYTKVDNYGQGDCAAHVAIGYVSGAKAGATDTLANPAACLFVGQVDAGASGVYLNPVEIQLNDGGFAASGVGAVFNLNRTNPSGALKAFWSGVRVQSIGSTGIDSGYFASGPMNVGLDLTYCSLTNYSGVKAAITFKEDDCFAVGAPVAGTYTGVTLSTNYFKYNASSGWTFVVGTNPTLQVISTQALVRGTFIVNPTGAYIAAQIDAGHVYLGNVAQGVQVQCDGPLMFTNNANTSSASAGAASALPAAPATYLRININGTIYKVPVYNS